MAADFDETKFPQQVQVILRAFKTYGLILADNGSDWYVSGAWLIRNGTTRRCIRFRGSRGKDFEVVDTGAVVK